MELVKKLPDVFEEFGEQRRNAFTSVFEIKENAFLSWALSAPIPQ